MSRIQTAFERLAGERRKALIPFITAGDPDAGLTVPLMQALVDAGADIIELGVPFSDPMADGPTIQRASERALAGGMTLKKVLQRVTAFRTLDDRTPVVLSSSGAISSRDPVQIFGYPVFGSDSFEDAGSTTTLQIFG